MGKHRRTTSDNFVPNVVQEIRRIPTAEIDIVFMEKPIYNFVFLRSHYVSNSILYTITKKKRLTNYNKKLIVMLIKVKKSNSQRPNWSQQSTKI